MTEHSMADCGMRISDLEERWVAFSIRNPQSAFRNRPGLTLPGE
jgi:hypothetical protein